MDQQRRASFRPDLGFFFGTWRGRLRANGNFEHHAGRAEHDGVRLPDGGRRAGGKRARRAAGTLAKSQRDRAGRRGSRHGLDRGRRLPDGLRPSLCRGAAAAPGAGGRLLDRPHARHQSRVRALRRGDRLRHLRRVRTARRGLSRTRRPRIWSPARWSSSPARRPIPLDQPHLWWAFVHGADWRHPTGPRQLDRRAGRSSRSSMSRWSTSRPMRLGRNRAAEREGMGIAAKGGLDDAEYAWGDEFEPDGVPLANTWQGTFPFYNSGKDGWLRTSPVGAFPPNGYGLYDMIGNVWEWTADWWSDSIRRASRAGSAARSSAGRASRPSDPLQIPRRVLKGGSHLCAPNYCRRYRPAARHAHPIDTSTSHIGFRCVVRPPQRLTNRGVIADEHNAYQYLSRYRAAATRPILLSPCQGKAEPGAALLTALGGAGDGRGPQPPGGPSFRVCRIFTPARWRCSSAPPKSPRAQRPASSRPSC